MLLPFIFLEKSKWISLKYNNIEENSFQIFHKWTTMSRKCPRAVSMVFPSPKRFRYGYVNQTAVPVLHRISSKSFTYVAIPSFVIKLFKEDNLVLDKIRSFSSKLKYFLIIFLVIIEFLNRYSDAFLYRLLKFWQSPWPWKRHQFRLKLLDSCLCPIFFIIAAHLLKMHLHTEPCSRQHFPI